MKKKQCLYCGNNPTNHAFTFVDETINIATTGMNRRFSRWWPVRKGVRIVNRLTPAFLSLLTFFHIVRWNTDKERMRDRGRVLWEEANRRGIEIRSLVLFGKYMDTYEARRGKKHFMYASIPTGLKDDPDSFWWMDDKGILKKKFDRGNVPHARGGNYALYRSARRKFRTLTPPVIVKPRIGSRGRHTLTAIHTEDELRHAFKVAHQICPFAVMEEHLVGSVYRGTVVDGVVAAVLRGDPPRVTGDGTHTIRELIEIKNEKRDPRIAAVVVKDTHLEFLLRSGYTLDTVIPAGKTIDLLEKIGISYGGMSAEVTPETHPKIFRYLAEAAKVIDYPVIGFDFIIEDVSRDPDTQRWGIIEANSAPFVNLHHDPIEGVPVNVAASVWDMIERKNII